MYIKVHTFSSFHFATSVITESVTSIFSSFERIFCNSQFKIEVSVFSYSNRISKQYALPLLRAFFLAITLRLVKF